MSFERHDIKNGLQLILAYIVLALEDPGLSEDNKKILRQAVERIKTIEQDLATEKEFLEGLQGEPKVVQLGTIIDSLRKRTSLILDVDPGTLQLKIKTRGFAEKIIYNLLDNSQRHGGDKITQVSISHHTDGERIIFVYQDNGVGVKPEEKEIIFKEGYGKHTGFGLFLIKLIVEVHGGQIRETGTEGARFEIAIPNSLFEEEKKTT
jgi:signal transduction histidine kinase